MKLNQNEYHTIVPSFLKLVCYLEQNNINFSIVFRTFGTDILKVIKSFKSFCEGKHPDFKNVSFPNFFQKEALKEKLIFG